MFVLYMMGDDTDTGVTITVITDMGTAVETKRKGSTNKHVPEIKRHWKL
jgi:hypothetical protein